MWSAGTKPKASSPQLLEISWLTLITQTSGFSCRHSHVSLPQRNRRQKRPCTNVFNLLQSWNVGGKSSRPLMLYTEWSGWQVLYQICLLPHLLPQFFSLLALNNLTFKSLKNPSLDILHIYTFSQIYFFQPSFQGHFPPSPLPNVLVFFCRLPIGTLQSSLP